MNQMGFDVSLYKFDYVSSFDTLLLCSVQCYCGSSKGGQPTEAVLIFGTNSTKSGNDECLVILVCMFLFTWF